jgi:hypothetical protein
MREIPPGVPYGADETVYVVVETLGPEAPARTTERADIETIITELLSGRFNDPIKVVAYNTLEHWTDDLSRDVAQEILCRCDIEGEEVPDYLEEFISNSFVPSRQADFKASCSNQSHA